MPDGPASPPGPRGRLTRFFARDHPPHDGDGAGVPEGLPWPTSGVSVGAEHVRFIRDTAPEAGLPDLDFDGSTFREPVDFAGLTFAGSVSFLGAEFDGPVSFAGATFRTAPSFDVATFRGSADFSGAVFCAGVRFFGSVFEDAADFAGARFDAQLELSGAKLNGSADFRGASLEGCAFTGTSFRGPAQFDGATFADEVSFILTEFHGESGFSGATFLDRADFTNVEFLERVSFQQAAFHGEALFLVTRFHKSTNFASAVFKGEAQFGGADFAGTSGWGRASFEGDAGFHGVKFGDAAYFQWSRFEAAAVFGSAVFRGETRFDRVVFGDNAEFSSAAAHGKVSFGDARFGGLADFLYAGFDAPALFHRVEFADNAQFQGVEFRGAEKTPYSSDRRDVGLSLELSATFAHSTFARDLRLRGVSCRGELDLEAATFENRIALGPMEIATRLRLDDTTFNRSVHVEASAARVTCDGATFHGGAELLLGGADVSLEGTVFGEDSLVAAIRAPRDTGAIPRVISLRGADVSRLTLSGVDLRPCRFAGANGLDGVRLQDVRLPEPPRSRPGRWWARRQTLAEEHHWRAQEGARTAGWYPEAVRPPSWLRPEPVVPTATELAGVYRALRKGREDSKNEPGAADFYYGEMEMRRHRGSTGRTVPWAERSVLNLYWLLSGYGLRAGRALIALAMVIVLGAGLLSRYGFEAGGHPEDGALLFALESTIGLLRAPSGGADVTAAGHVIQLVLRIVGPVLVALAILSVRARVRR